MVACCGTAFAFGDKPVRQTAVLLGCCWTAATIAELILTRQAEPVIVADIVCGFGLLILAAFSHRIWLWIMLCLQSTLFLVHAALYHLHQPPAAAEVIANNGLTFAGLAVLLGAALWPLRQDKTSPKWLQNANLSRNKFRGYD